jgi:hypothetical protein
MPKHQSWSVSSQESCGGGDGLWWQGVGAAVKEADQEVKRCGGRESISDPFFEFRKTKNPKLYPTVHI